MSLPARETVLSLPDAPAELRAWRVAPTLLFQGEPFLWLTSGALALALVMIAALLVLVAVYGASSFWPGAVIQVRTLDGKTCAGEVTRDEQYRITEEALGMLAPAAADAARVYAAQHDGFLHRRLLRTGNYELTGEHFQWVNTYAVTEQMHPKWMLVLERLTWGRFYGTPKAFLCDGQPIATDPSSAWSLFAEYHAPVRARWLQRRNLERHDIGVVNKTLENARLSLRKVELRHGKASREYATARETFETISTQANREYDRIREKIAQLNNENARYQLLLETCDGKEKTLALAEIVRAYPANQLSLFQRLAIYSARWWEFLSDEPREANSEGGVFPAIFGTVIMTLIMTLVVVPFGVLASLYLHEYAKAGVIVSAVRIAVNNLAGVPSIVFGVFGLGFFCYLIGASIDGLFYEARLPNPTFGKGGVLWASLTLALLTLPVVIVATEEALSAVPNSMREGSFACGASKWQTIRRIVLPHAMPGIMTGTILAIARGAGEVAPLMLVGAVKLAPELPVDTIAPFVHVERSFMHLGFHIFDLGFQSQNSEAAKPMVFVTTLLLIVIIAVLNMAAVGLRSHLRRRFVASQV